MRGLTARTENPGVGGSIPSLPTILFPSLAITVGTIGTASVLWPVSFIAAEREMPARSRFLTAERLRSWSRSPGRPASLHALIQARRSDLIGLP
jgi:hypothetical protein